jgi:7,8-dihydro-6-hydroxymethylpterin-pyrophosphokinase
MHERDFVMHPLAALAPDLSIRGEKVREIAARLPAEGLRQLPAGLQTPREA